MLVRELLAQPDAWEEVTFDETQSPIAYTQPLVSATPELQPA